MLACFDSPGPLTTQPSRPASFPPTYIAAFPGGHLVAQISLNLLRHLLEKCAGSASAAGAGRNLCVKLRMPMDCRICCATRTSSVRSPPGAGVSETRMVSPMPPAELRPWRRWIDHAFRSHAGFGEAEVQRIIAAGGEGAVHVDEVLHAANFGAQNNLIRAEPNFCARSAEFSALTTIASMVTARASSGSARRDSHPSCG